MAVPKKRTSSSKRDMRRSHDALSRTYSVICPKCGEGMLRHRVCMACGTYRGKQILSVGKKDKSSATQSA